MAGGCSGGARDWIVPPRRPEAAIDDDDPAGWELGWREYPIAGSGHVAAQGRATGVNECFRAGHERGRELHATEFVVCSRKAPSALARRQIARGRGKALFEGLDQRFLPGLTLELPSAEANEDCDP